MLITDAQDIIKKPEEPATAGKGESMEFRLLIIEDEPDIRLMIEEALSLPGYRITSAEDGQQALQLFSEKEGWDLVVLDLMLPKVDGLTVLRKIREKSTVPVLILSARNGEYEKVLGLEYGADDYITKPFSVIELQARVKAFLRRANEYARSMPERENEAGQTQIRIGDLLIDPGNLTVQKRGEGISLTAKEFDILRLLAGNPSRVYTKIQIYESVWDENFLKDENVINVTIRRLRENIEDNPSAPVYIKTVWGIGYKMGTGEAE